MPDEIHLNFSSPSNKSVLDFLGIQQIEGTATYTPAEVNWFSLSTHPDLVEYFWKLAAGFDLKCACVINKTSNPLLVHPASGIVFGLAGGTSTLAFRLPEPERTAALSIPGYGAEYKYPHSTVYARAIGIDWVLVKPYDKNNVELSRKAFEYAGTLV